MQQFEMLSEALLQLWEKASTASQKKEIADQIRQLLEDSRIDGATLQSLNLETGCCTWVLPAPEEEPYNDPPDDTVLDPEQFYDELDPLDNQYNPY